MTLWICFSALAIGILGGWLLELLGGGVNRVPVFVTCGGCGKLLEVTGIGQLKYHDCPALLLTWQWALR